MKSWNSPALVELNISETAHGNGNGIYNGNGHKKYDDPTNKTGNGNGYGHCKGTITTIPETPVNPVINGAANGFS